MTEANADKRRHIKLLAAALGIEGEVETITHGTGPWAKIGDVMEFGETEDHALLVLEHELREQVLARWCTASEKVAEAQAEFQKYDKALCGEDPNG